MKKHIGYNFWILSLTVVLMLLIMAAQMFTIKNLRGLKTGNQEAAVIFTINNRLQEIVNTAAVLETRMIRNELTRNKTKPVIDSLVSLGYNGSVLEKLNVDSSTSGNFLKLNQLIRRQVAVSFKIVEAADSGDGGLKKQYVDSLAGLMLSDSIYKAAINIEKGLEARLKNTFSRNTEASQKLSALNKIFAIIALAAILILGTIIINRHLRQVSLIRQLEKANEEVKKSALIKDQFLANMSHEIRTPLNAIKGFSRLLHQTPLNQEQQKFSEIIEDSSNNLLNLVNDILDIAKIEAGKMVVEAKEFDLKRMLQTLESMFMNTAREKQLEFSWQIADGVPQFLHGDADRIYQVLVNLVSNAFKFTEKGFIKINVFKQAESDEEISLQFCVQDSGIGIPLKQHDLIFERFQQAGSPQESMQKGTGLGLAIVKNIAALLGGSVAVSSTEGKGAVFTVTLPFKKEVTEVTSGKGFGADDDTPIKFTGAKVLIAEDNQVNQLLITALLRQYGIDPVIKENGAEVLEILKTQQFDLLLLDIQMPLLDGYKTCIAIRQTENMLPVIAMTAYVMEAEKEKCKAAGMNGYLAKPLDGLELRNALKKYLAAFMLPGGGQNTIKVNPYLLQLAGGDEQIASVILNQIKDELPAEINKLKKVISEKNTGALPAVCHHLISSISPLGNNSSAMQKITALQQLKASEAGNTILENAAEVIDELEKIYNSLK
ncbi:MAG: response regulator [Ferruginibacter sp.]|nr:response regulator [Ferruginibacter sp.]